MSPSFVLIGRSGSGKGTQAQLLIEVLKRQGPAPLYIETGARFREFAAKKGETAARVAAALQGGELLPDFLAVWNWGNLLIKNLKNNVPLVLDGAPRTKLEAMVLDTAFAFYQRRPIFIVYVDVSAAWAREHLLGRGRADDNHRDITERLAWFDKQVVPALNFFKQHERYTFLHINGEQTIEQVHEEIMSSL